MVIYSTTNDKPVLGRMTFCQMLTKSHSVYRGRPKNSSSCVAMEYSSQATSTNPHFFGSHPPPCWFLGRVVNLFNFVMILLPSGIKKYLTMLLKCVITPSENYEKSTEIYNNAAAKNWKNSYAVEMKFIHWRSQGVCNSLSQLTKERRATI